jgi:hypothetical protein
LVTDTATPLVDDSVLSTEDMPLGDLDRDPFVEISARAGVVEIDANTPPLARVPLEDIRVRGVVLQATPLALAEDPEGKGHVLRVGDAVGTQGGRIDAIDPNGVVVTETRRTWTGEVTRVSFRLPLGAESPEPSRERIGG